jgi:hypothetical protein
MSSGRTTRASVNRCSTAAASALRATAHPTLTVTWQPQVGQEPWIGSYDHTLSDRMNLHVDYATRNLVLGNTDEQLAGPGQSMSVRRTYNSVTAGTATGARRRPHRHHPGDDQRDRVHRQQQRQPLRHRQQHRRPGMDRGCPRPRHHH